jgi:hypothetical protein
MKLSYNEKEKRLIALEGGFREVPLCSETTLKRFIKYYEYSPESARVWLSNLNSHLWERSLSLGDVKEVLEIAMINIDRFFRQSIGLEEFLSLVYGQFKVFGDHKLPVERVFNSANLNVDLFQLMSDYILPFKVVANGKVKDEAGTYAQAYKSAQRLVVDYLAEIGTPNKSKKEWEKEVKTSLKKVQPDPSAE